MALHFTNWKFSPKEPQLKVEKGDGCEAPGKPSLICWSIHFSSISQMTSLIESHRPKGEFFQTISYVWYLYLGHLVYFKDVICQRIIFHKIAEMIKILLKKIRKVREAREHSRVFLLKYIIRKKDYFIKFFNNMLLQIWY